MFSFDRAISLKLLAFTIFLTFSLTLKLLVDSLLFFISVFVIYWFFLPIVKLLILSYTTFNTTASLKLSSFLTWFYCYLLALYLSLVYAADSFWSYYCFPVLSLTLSSLFSIFDWDIFRPLTPTMALLDLFRAWPLAITCCLLVFWFAFTETLWYLF